MVRVSVAFYHTLDDHLAFAFFPVYGTWFYIQLDGLGDGGKSFHDSLNFDCRVFPDMPGLIRAANAVTMKSRLMGQEILERKGFIFNFFWLSHTNNPIIFGNLC